MVRIFKFSFRRATGCYVCCNFWFCYNLTSAAGVLYKFIFKLRINFLWDNTLLVKQKRSNVSTEIKEP